MSEETSKNKKMKQKFAFGGKKRSKKKLLVVVILLLIFAGGGYAFYQKSKDKVGEFVETATVERGTIEQKIGINAIVSGTDSAEISSNLPYEIVKINVKEGDIVAQGDILAVLDDRVLRNELNMAKSELQLAEMQISEQSDVYVDTSTAAAELQIQQAISDQQEAQRQMELRKSLLDSGAIPKEEFVQAQLAVQKATAAVEVAKESLRKTQSEINRAIEASKVKGSQLKSLDLKREIIKQKQSDLEKVNIKSPISGTITRVNAKLGRLATASDAGASLQGRSLFVVENLEKLRMKVNVSEYDIGKVAVGQKVSVSSDVLGEDQVEAVVSRIAPTGEMKENSTTREMVIPVEVEIIQKDPRLIAGITAQATIELNKREDILKVPVDAIFEKEGKNYIALYQKDDTVKLMEVELGLESTTETEILSKGIQEGDRIILNPRTTFKDGDKVAVMEMKDKDGKEDGKKDDKKDDGESKDGNK